MMAFQEAMEASPEKAKVKPEKMKGDLGEMVVMVDVFEGRLGKVGTMNLEASQGKFDTIAEYQEVPKEETIVETNGALED
jgi:hypothetical protein